VFRDIIGDIKKFVDESLMLVTALSPIIGYDKAPRSPTRRWTGIRPCVKPR
jgi:fumarate hydratase class II